MGKFKRGNKPKQPANGYRGNRGKTGFVRNPEKQRNTYNAPPKKSGTKKHSFSLETIQEAITLHHGNLSKASEALGCCSSTMTKYVHDIYDLADFVSRAKEEIIDVAEYYVHKQVVDGNLAVCQWFLERKRKSGYSLRQEVTGADGGELSFAQKAAKMNKEELKEAIQERMKFINNMSKNGSSNGD